MDNIKLFLGDKHLSFYSWLIVGLFFVFVSYAFFGGFATVSDFNIRANEIVAGKAEQKTLIQTYEIQKAAPGVPLLTYTFKDISSVLLQGIVIPFLMLSAGLCLLYFIFGSAISGWPKSLIAGVSGLLSMFVFAIASVILSKFPRYISSPISLVFSFSIVLIAWPKVKKTFLSNLDRANSLLLLFVVVIYCGWLAMLPLSSYPSIITAGYGDTPSYYRVAANLVYGSGMMEDYFVGDYLTGKYGYMTTAVSLPVLLTSFFFYLFFGINGYSFSIFQSFLGILTALTLSGVISSASRRSFSIVWMIVSILVFMLHPFFHWQMGLGSSTNAMALSAAVFVGILLQDFDEKKVKMPLLTVASLSMLIIRPEGAVLAVVLLLTQLLRYIVFDNGSAYRLSVIKISLSLSLTIVVLYFFLNNIYMLPKGLGLFFLRYSPEIKLFTVPFDGYGEINHYLNVYHFNFGGDKSLPPVNLMIGAEILNYPIQFLKTIAITLYNFLSGIGSFLLKGFSSQDFSFFIILILTFIAFIKSEQRPVIIACLLFITFLPFLNWGAGDRHFYPVIMIMTALSLRSMASLMPFDFVLVPPRSVLLFFIGIVGIAILLSFNFYSIFSVRHNKNNNSYVSVIDYLRTNVKQESVILTSSPQLITCMTGFKSIGGTWLTENLSYAKERFRPDYILIDDLRDGPKNYSLFKDIVDDERLIAKKTSGLFFAEKRDNIRWTSMDVKGEHLVDWKVNIAEAGGDINGGFEDWLQNGVPAGWRVNKTNLLSKERCIKTDGLFSLKISTGKTTVGIIQQIKDFKKYRGEYIILTSNIRKEDSGSVCLSINDGVSESVECSSAKHGTFEKLVGLKKISPHADRLEISINMNSLNGHAYIDDLRLFALDIIRKDDFSYKTIKHMPRERYVILKRSDA